ncbi:hypothetical protein MUS1_11185 [Marinomonas ushuaiensis DSM 15871]|uniref:Uncharacterized protein n=1 Tax=Marinomonas ushuaiensis DSM 15871 TaxID=1122207 RepID=X7E5V1_9GAMM|nr:hypothetical protein MUS1_11185 [Marinomonas ushuaiensis DSM 15871]
MDFKDLKEINDGILGDLAPTTLIEMKVIYFGRKIRQSWKVN